jgi:hypothetical protein
MTEDEQNVFTYLPTVRIQGRVYTANIPVHVFKDTNNNNNSICIAPLKIKFARGALQSKRTQMYKWAKPAKSDEVKKLKVTR